MKKSILKFALFALVASTALTSCMSSSDKLEKSAEDVNDAKEDLREAEKEYDEQYNQFKIESNEQIESNSEVIRDLRLKSKDKKAEAKVEYERSIDELEAKNQALKVRVEMQEKTSNEKWHSFKDEFKHDMNELGQSIKDIGKNNVK